MSPGPVRLWGVAVALALLSTAASAAPVIEVSPTVLDFPPVTLGDTAVVVLNITNRGDALLTVTDVGLPPGVSFGERTPFSLSPDSVRKVAIAIAALDTISDRRELSILSDDPANPTVVVDWPNRVLALEMETIALTTGSPPIGEPVVVESVPFPGVNVERMTVYFRSGDARNFQPIPMTSNARVFIGVIPGVSVQEGTLEYYVVAENSGYQGVDPEEGDRRPFKVGIGSPGQFQLSPVVRNPGLTWGVGESVDFILALTRGTVFQKGTLWYRQGGDTTYDSVNILEMSFTGIAATIPGTAVGPTGIQYWAELNTLTTRLTIPERTPETTPIEIRVSIENLIEPDTHPAERYRLFSAPYEAPGSTALGTILADQTEFGSYDPTRWRAYRYLPEQGANVELPAGTPSDFELRPGRAFWIISRSAHRIDTAPAPGVSTRLFEAWPIIVQPGWNAIGTPYDFPVAWSSVRRPVTVGDPVAFDPGRNDYAEATPAELVPFEGYFVQNTSSVPETLYVDPRAPAPAPALTARPVDAPGFGWRLEARSEGSTDLANLAGVAAGAEPERDARDAGKPPSPPGSRVRLAIANRDWNEAPGLYRRDIRPPAEGHAWELEVTSATAGEPIEIVIRPHGDVPPDLEIRLLDREQGSVLDPAPDADGTRGITVLSPGPGLAYRLRLLAGSQDYIDRGAADATSLPAEVTLDPVAPNPARGALRLRFGVPRATPVRLEVFDVTGQRVTTLLDGGTLPAGFHSIVWQGTRQDGSRVASGMYYYRLTAGPEARVARAVLIR